LITGLVDLTNICTHMVLPLRHWDRTKGKNELVCVFLYLADHLTEHVRLH
jgi:hypothetical protein